MPGDELKLTRVCLEDFIGAIDTWRHADAANAGF